jgi:micrococcal nuclease
LSEKKAQAKPINLRPHKYTLADVLLPDGMNLKQELVKQGWCWWYRRYASEDIVMKDLKKEAREARKELWADSQPVPHGVLRKARIPAH